MAENGNFDSMKKTSRQHKAEKFWDRASGSYDREEKKDEKIYLQLIEKLKGHLESNDIVLDFGCGTGLFSTEIAKFVKSVHGIDISSKMIEKAKSKAETAGIHNVEYFQATIFDERLKPGTYDVILALYILHLAEDTQIVMRRMKELLKPGGLILSVTPCMGEKPFLSLLFSAFSKVGIVPEIRSFKHSDLEQLLKDANFQLLQNELLKMTSNQYYMVAKK